MGLLLILPVAFGTTFTTRGKAQYIVSVGLAVLLSVGLIGLLLQQLIGRHTRRELWYHVPEWKAFLLRRYWKRTWIVQEVALARTLFIHCGEHEMTWEDLIEPRFGYGGGSYTKLGPRTLAKYWGHLRDEPLVFLNVLRLTEGYGFGSISKFAHATRYTECEDQRDRIYALLAMENPRLSYEPILPDYTISVPELFVETYRLRSSRSNHHDQLMDLDFLVRGLKIIWRQAYNIYCIFGSDERAMFRSLMALPWLNNLLPSGKEYWN